MRLFQFLTVYPPFLGYFQQKYPESERASFEQRKALFLNQRYYASHILKPVYDGSADAFLTVTNDRTLQDRWALEQGLKASDPLEILRAQIEHHRTEVLYSLNPITFDSTF